jgi:hypothetical protein
MEDSTYFTLVGIIDKFFWSGTLINGENLPRAGPAVFVGNHLATNGPIGTMCSIHLRFYPWIISDMVDKELAPDYLRIDFVEPSLRLKPPLSGMIAKLISFISVPMLTSIGCVPINQKQYADLQNSLHESTDLLKQGKFVLIFPEDSEAELNPQTNMRPFLKGFTRLGELYYKDTGNFLSFYPVAIHQSKKIVVGEPVPFNPDNSSPLERSRLKDVLEEKITDMYLGMEKGIEPSSRQALTRP